MAVELATGYVSLTVSAKGIKEEVEKAIGQPVEDSVKRASESASKNIKLTGQDFTKFGVGALAVAGVVGAGLFAAGDAASDLGESVNAVQVTFGDAAGGILKLGEDAATSMGLSNTAFNGLAVQFSAFATTIAGRGGDVVGTMKDLTGRAADFASVMNIDVKDAATLFQSGLAGETEPLRKYGIDLSAAAVASFAAANGIGTVGKELTEAEKVTARYGLLMESTSKNQGDFANTSDSAANATRIAKAEMENAAASLGTALTPAMAFAAGAVADLAGGFVKLNDATGGWLAKGAGIAALALGAAGAVSIVVGQVIKFKAGLDKVHGAMTLTEGGLSSLGKVAVGTGVALGVVGLATIAATAYYGDNAKKKAILTGITNDFVDALNAEADGQTGAVDASIAKGLSDKKLIENAKILGLSTKDLADIVMGKSVPAYASLQKAANDTQFSQSNIIATSKILGVSTDELAGKNDDLRIAFGYVNAKLAPLNDGLADAKDQMAVTAEVGKELATTTDKTTTATEGLIVPVDDLGSSLLSEQQNLDLTREATERAATWDDNLKKAAEEAARKVDVFSASLQGQIDKLAELYPKEYDAVTAKYDYAKQTETTMVAVDNMNTTLKDHKSKQEDVKTATDNARDAIIDQSEKYATLEGATLGSQGAIARQITSLENQRDALAPGSPLRLFLDGYIQDLNGIQDRIDTQLVLHITSDATNINAPGYLPRAPNSHGATGGWRTGSTLVGEFGPEIVDFRQPGFIHTAPNTRSIMSEMQSGGDQMPDTMTLIIEGTPFTAIVQRSQRQLADALTAGRR